MRKITNAIIFVLCMLCLPHSQVLSQSRDRSEVPDIYKWDLTELFASDEAFAEAKKKTAERIDEIASFKGTLNESASKLLACLEFRAAIGKELRRLSSYTYNKSNQDTRDSGYRALNQETNQLINQFIAKISFIEPELLAMREATIQEFLKAEPGIEPFRFYLSDLLRRKKNTFSESTETVIAEAGQMVRTPASLYSIFSNVEFPYPSITLSSGETVRLDIAGFRRYRSLPVQEDRDLVFRTFYNALNQYRGTFGALMYAKVNANLFNTRARGYDNCLEMTLAPNNIDVAVFHNLIANANANLDKFHRYLEIKKRMLGVDTLRYTDLSVKTIKGVELNYDVEEAKKLILESLRPLRESYTSIVKKAFESRWIDIFPTPGKRSNGYNDSGAYAEHPYILMNFNNKYSDVATLTHELGHSLHTYFADRSQPFPTANFSSFIAEVASTFNEVLLKKKVLENIKDDDLRLFLLLANLENSIFGQARISEFELGIHQLVENGSSLTGDNIAKIYLDITRKYYGHDQGICLVPDYIDMDWTTSRLLFIRTYRIYVYATSLTAATALAEKIFAAEEGTVDKYLGFLSAGGSDYPINILRKAGVDMTSPEPFQKTMDSMVRAMDEIERILKKKGL